MTQNSLSMTTQKLEELCDLAKRKGCNINWAINILKSHLSRGKEPMNKVNIAREAVFKVTGYNVE